MRSRIPGLLLVLMMSLTFAPSCNMMSPGNVGWFCEDDSDCKDGGRCLTYRHEDSDHTNKLCTGDRRLEDTSSNYGWIALVMTWIMLVGLPGLVVVLIIVGKIKNALNKNDQQQ